MGKPHAGFDEAGAGNGLSGTAPAFDPTCEGLEVKFLRATRLYILLKLHIMARKHRFLSSRFITVYLNIGDFHIYIL